MKLKFTKIVLLAILLLGTVAISAQVTYPGFPPGEDPNSERVSIRMTDFQWVCKGGSNTVFTFDIQMKEHPDYNPLIPCTSADIVVYFKLENGITAANFDFTPGNLLVTATNLTWGFNVTSYNSAQLPGINDAGFWVLIDRDITATTPNWETILQVEVPYTGTTYPTAASFAHFMYFMDPPALVNFGSFWTSMAEDDGTPHAFDEGPYLPFTCLKPNIAVTPVNECENAVVDLTAVAVATGLCGASVPTTYHTGLPCDNGNKISDSTNYVVSASTTLYAKSTLGCDSIAPIPVTMKNCNKVKLDLKLFLQGVTREGSYTFKGVSQTGAYMSNYPQDPMYLPKMLNLFPNFNLPVNSPYSVAPNSYSGISSQAGVADKVVDWVLVELWQTNYVPGNIMSFNYTVSEKRSLLLQINGSVVDVNGDLPEFDPREGNYRIVVKHRNHMGVMSAETREFKSGIVQYDFTTAISKAQTDMMFLPSHAQMIMMNSVNKVACLYAGELNMDGLIDNQDLSIYASDIKAENYPSIRGTYTFSDVNMDGYCDNQDLSCIALSRNSLLNLFYVLGGGIKSSSEKNEIIKLLINNQK